MTAEEEQRALDDVLGLASLLGFECPPAAIVIRAVKALVDLGFAAYFAAARQAARDKLREQASGLAAAESSAVTTVLAHGEKGPA